ncbi:MAG: 2-amino-4-hydroxy-6-hydroxymethyldihydropteridine diphosphokinase [Pseudomonadota bacterium]
MNRHHGVDAFIGVGSNLSHPVQQVEAAFERIDGMPETRLTATSSLYRSSPFGGIEQPDYVNAVAGVSTNLDARALLEALLSIEQQQGRERDGSRWGPRVIDLDLLIYGSDTVDEPGLQVPHPGIAQRNFVLLPLGELAPDLVIPGLGALSSIAVNSDEPRIERIARI